MNEFYRIPAIITHMRRTLLLFLAIIFVCWAVSSSGPKLETNPLPTIDQLSLSPTPLPARHLPSVTPTSPPTFAVPSASFTPQNTPIPTVTQTPIPTLIPTAEATITLAAVPQFVQATVLLHPDGGVYVGDQVSFEVISPQLGNSQNSASQVLVSGPDGSRLGTAEFGVYGLGQRVEAMMMWAWDTRGLSAGDYPLTFAIEPGGQVWTETVTLLPQESLPWPEPQAHWASARSRCCTLYYITGTAAERDISSIIRQADEQARQAVQHMGIDFTAPITITLLSRVLGHGGFASQEIDVTYLDRNYAGSDFGLVLHHEMIHILDGRLGGEYRPALFVEGLAVYKSGGHFKPEPLMPRAATLLATETGLGWYIPLAELADHFYLLQHEIGYLEGAALIKYMVDTWGWEAFSSFYRDMHPTEDNSQAAAIDAALQKHFQITFSELEAKFKDALSRIQVTSVMRDDMRLTVEYYDTVRRYQQTLDPSAFYQNAWLADAGAMRSRGIVADYLRHPRGDDNLSLEVMLSNAFTELKLAQYAHVDQILSAVNAVLDATQLGDSTPFEVNSQAADFYAIIQAVHQAGYETQHVELGDNEAQVRATADSVELVEFSLQREADGWRLIKNWVFSPNWLAKIPNLLLIEYQPRFYR